MIRAEAFARAGLMGNPSDGYGGSAIACQVKNFRAVVTCRPSPGAPAPGGTLLDATRSRFERFVGERGMRLREGAYVLEAESDIPFKVGLAGSSAIITAAMRVLMAYHDVSIADHELPSLILAVETEDLGIPGGLMDRVIQVYGGAMYMDLSLATLDAQGFGDYRRLPTANLPPLFLAWRADLAEGSEIVHGDLRERFRARQPLVVETMAELASLADRARDMIEAGRGRDIGPLMDRNLDLRDRIAPLSAGNRELVSCGRRGGANVKFAGSGGAVVGAYDGDPDRLGALRTAYTTIGAGFLAPEIG